MAKMLNVQSGRKPVSTKCQKIEQNMRSSRNLNKMETMRKLDIENSRLLIQLKKANSTISFRKQKSSFSNHLRRSSMLSKFKKDERTGQIIAKKQKFDEKQIRLSKSAKKLRMMSSQGGRPKSLINTPMNKSIQICWPKFIETTP